MTASHKDGLVDVAFTAEQLALLETVAAARGCTVPEFILQEALVRAREVIALSGAATDHPDATD